MSIGWIIYLTSAAIAGYFFARMVYTAPYSAPHQLQDHKLSTALGVWIIYGLCWPLLISLGSIAWLIDGGAKRIGRAIGDRLFRSKA